jgi:hypothetical protein
MEDKQFTLLTRDDDGNPIEKYISIEAITRFNKKFDVCRHTHVKVDEDLWNIECQTCGEKLDPIRYLVNLAKDESREEFRLKKLDQEYERITDILAIKSKTRCQHCGKITTVNTEGDIKKIGLLLRYVDTKKNQELNKKVPRNLLTNSCGTGYDGYGRNEHEFYLLRESKEKNIYVCKYCGKTIIEESDRGQE